ncbi:hypothetical protein FRC07_013731 [Ceratobasidium sp. 392]|nr:hypothetical protein FRC07_013731 [Ceratobasidium sp. 392]
MSPLFALIGRVVYPCQIRKTRRSCKPVATTQADPVADAMDQLSYNLETLDNNYKEGESSPQPATGEPDQSCADTLLSSTEVCSVDAVETPPLECSSSKSSGLLMIPFEVFTNIISHTQPGGLLALARTCKTLRNILMNKSTMHIWEAAEQKTPRLPARPKGMSSPQYAALAFFNECSVCGENENIKLYAKLRVRLCVSCSVSELVDISTIEVIIGSSLENLLSVIFKMPTNRSRQNTSTEEELSTGSPHCLRRDLLAYRITQKRFLQSRNLNGLRLWEGEQHELVHVHEAFAKMLVPFLVHPKLTPLRMTQLGDPNHLFSDESPMDYRDFNNGDDLKFAGEANVNLSVTKFTHEQCLRMHMALQEMKQLFHPYRGVLEALGVETNPLYTLMGMASPDSNPFEDYPYPTAATALSWPIFSDVQHVEASQIVELVHQDTQETMRYIQDWRKEGEKELVEWWKSDGESSDNQLTNSIVKVKESTATTEHLPADLRLLLRADTILSFQKPDCSGYQDAILYYPFYYKNPTSCIYPQAPSSMNSTRIYRHLKAEKIAKALLRDLGMPDIAAIELRVIGASFMCGRCQDCRPKRWMEIVKHYRQEAQLWHKLQAQQPQFKTNSSVVFLDAHDLNSIVASRPLARRLTNQEAVDANNLYSSNTSQQAACILCRNYHLHPVTKNQVQLQSHMKDVHGVTEPVQRLHYTSTDAIKSFGSWGKKWQEKWDKNQSALEAVMRFEVKRWTGEPRLRNQDDLGDDPSDLELDADRS